MNENSILPSSCALRLASAFLYAGGRRRSNILCPVSSSQHDFLQFFLFPLKTAAGKFVVAVQRNCWRTRYFTKIRKFEKTTRVEFQLMILHF